MRATCEERLQLIEEMKDEFARRSEALRFSAGRAGVAGRDAPGSGCSERLAAIEAGDAGIGGTSPEPAERSGAEAAKLRAQGANLVDFGAGEPHFNTPRHIKDAAIAAIEANFTRYTVVPGIPDVRKAIVERHACDFGSDYSIDEAIFTTGGKHALFDAVQILVDHGDEVILPVPYWVSFKDIVQYAGGKVVYLETSEAESFRITADAIEGAITPRTKAIILNSPSNPAGSVVTAEDLGTHRPRRPRARYLPAFGRVLRVPQLCLQAGLRRLLHLRQQGDLVILGSLSKTYAMTGWRAGFALASKQVTVNLSKLQSQLTSNATSIVQKAAIAALTSSQECVAAISSLLLGGQATEQLVEVGLDATYLGREIVGDEHVTHGLTFSGPLGGVIDEDLPAHPTRRRKRSSGTRPARWSMRTARASATSTTIASPTWGARRKVTTQSSHAEVPVSTHSSQLMEMLSVGIVPPSGPQSWATRTGPPHEVGDQSRTTAT